MKWQEHLFLSQKCWIYGTLTQDAGRIHVA